MKPTWRKVYRWPHEHVPEPIRIQPIIPPSELITGYDYVCDIGPPKHFTLHSETYETHMLFGSRDEAAQYLRAIRRYYKHHHLKCKSSSPNQNTKHSPRKPK